MITLNCFTNGFAGHLGSVNGKAPKTCQWVYYQNPFDGITIFNNGHAFEYDPRDIQSKYKVAWLQESRALRPHMYEDIWARRDLFDAILTHDLSLVSADPSKFRRCIRGGVHLPASDWRMYPKSKGVAMLVSEKNETVGHRLRHELMAHITGVDFYGAGTPAGYVDKVAVLKDYCFVIVIEAGREGICFTDHLLDMIALGCVPIYWGTEHIGEFLDVEGILPISNLDTFVALQYAVNSLNRNPLQAYASYYPAAQENFERLPKFEITEDWFLRYALQDMV